jgi:CHAT domain-containing protein
MHLLAGDEVLGFASALLVQGSKSLVAPVVPVPDTATISLMTSYHRELIAGRSPAQALAAAQQKAAADGPAARAAAAAFVCTGAGF